MFWPHPLDKLRFTTTTTALTISTSFAVSYDCFPLVLLHHLTTARGLLQLTQDQEKTGNMANKRIMKVRGKSTQMGWHVG